MNKCFFMGQIKEEINFDFLYGSKYISIAYTKLELLDKNIIKIYGIDNIADYMYQNFEKNDYIIMEGKIRIINKQIEVEIYKIDKTNKG